MKAQLMAISLVAVLTLCALAPASSATYVPEYDIDMRAGDVFTYTPETSLPAKLDFASEQDWASWNDDNTTLSVTFPEPVTERQLLIRAVWTSETGGLTQTAFQAINFRAFGHVTIDGQSSLDIQRAVQHGTLAGTIVYAPTINEVEGTKTTLTCQMDENPYVDWDSSKSAIVVKSDIPNSALKDIVCTITAENTATDDKSNLRAEIVTAKVTVSVGSEMVITGSSVMETYAGCTDTHNVYEITTNYDAEGVQITKTVGGDYPDGFASIVDGNVVIDPSKATLGGDDYRRYAITVTATATVDGKETSASKEITVTVWKSLDFMTVPTIDDVEVAAKDGDNSNVAFSATIAHATHVVIDWGDGDYERIDADGYVYAKDHSYKDAKTYVISVTAVNAGQGATVHYVLYNAADGSSITDYEPEEEPEERDGSLLWLLFAAIAVMLAAVYAMMYPDILVIGGAVISAILSVTLYIGWL